jgi:hypothetical protein
MRISEFMLRKVIRQVIKEAVEEEDWDSWDDDDFDDEPFNDETEDLDYISNWGDSPGYLPYGKNGRMSDKHNKVVMKKGEKIHGDNNPVYALLQDLFVKNVKKFTMGFKFGGGLSPYGLLNSYASVGLEDYPQLYGAIFVKDNTKRREQVKCVFDCLKLVFPDLKSGGIDASDREAADKLSKSYEKYVVAWKKMSEEKRAGIVWGIIDKMQENRLLPEGM